jgi:AraC family transcriptional regulator
MLHIEVGSPRKFHTDPPFFPTAFHGYGFMAGMLPPHTIHMYMRGSSHFLAMHTRPTTFDVGMNSDKLQRVQCRGGEYLLGQKDMEFTFLSRSSVEVTVLHFEDSFLDRLGIGWEARRAMDEHEPVGSDPQLEHVMSALRLALAQGGEQGLYVEHLAAAALVRSLSKPTTGRGPSSPSGHRPEVERLRRAEEFMHAHLSQGITLGDLAAVANMSVPHFCRCFKHWKGCTPHQFVTQLRMEHARRLLTSTEWTIGHVALECGYSTQSHFGQQFRKSHGMSPSQFRAVVRS